MTDCCTRCDRVGVGETLGATVTKPVTKRSAHTTTPDITQKSARIAHSHGNGHPSLTTQLQDAASDVIREALTRRCDQCRADIGHLCSRRGGITHDLTGRLHPPRTHGWMRLVSLGDVWHGWEAR